MGSYLNHIVGRRLSNWTFGISTTYLIGEDDKGNIEIPLLLTFDDFDLRVYNSYEIHGVNDLNELVEEKLQHKIEKKKYIDLLWSKSRSIRILLDDDSYNGPEAMTLNGPNNLYVVWN